MDPIRILHVLNGLNNGGTESVIMNWYRNIDRSKIQFDFLIRSNCNVFADEIATLGGRVYVTAEFPKRYFQNLRDTLNFFKKHSGEYTAIHVHGNSMLYTNIFKIAKNHGVKTRIFHSHSTRSLNSLFSLIHRFNSKTTAKLITHRFACGEKAGKWAFGKAYFKVINNGINLERFKFDENARLKARASLGIENDFVCGHVGRFEAPKNHAFVIDVFSGIIKREPSAKLLLVGDGSLQNSIKAKVASLKLTDKVVFLNNRSDVNKLLQAMDCFIFPSLYEGLGVVAIESQATGLETFVSDRVPSEATLTDCVHTVSLEKSAEEWADLIVSNIGKDRLDRSKQVAEKGYDIKNIVAGLESFYLSL